MDDTNACDSPEPDDRPTPSRWRRWRRRLAALLLLLLAGPPVFCWLATPAPGPVSTLPDANPDAEYEVRVLDWGYHTSIVVEQPPGWNLGPPGDRDARFVEYSWGDYEFYVEGNFWPHALLPTLFLPTPSVLYVRGWDAAPAVGPQCRRRTVNAEQLRELVEGLERTVQRTPDGERVDAMPAVKGFRGRFYPSRLYYGYWSDCNAWTVNRLREAGLAGSSAGVLFVTQVPSRLEGFEPCEDR